MSSQVYINLPVADLPKSIAFFTALGYRFNPQFTDDTATCMVISEHIHVMLLTRTRFQEFVPKAICDARQATEVLICLDFDSREAVDAMVERAVAAGGNTYRPSQDHGFMYQHGYQDLDGHIWELVYMVPGAGP